MAEKLETEICGWLNINKEASMSSAKVVREVKKITRAKKVGHAGTLDPLATGVLPIALGEATKTIRFMMNGKKTYEFIVKWGESTDTDDAEGKIILRNSKRPSEIEIKEKLNTFKGIICQKPPRFSAVKINGIRSYKLARESKDFDLTPREVRITKFDIVECINSDYTKFIMVCEKGVYVRSLARDLAETLGTVAHVSKLCRLSVNNFYYKDAIFLADLSKLLGNSHRSDCLISIADVLDDIPALEVGIEQARKLSCGQRVYVLDYSVDRKKVIDEVYVTCQNDPLAIAKFENGTLLPIRVFKQYH